MEQRLLAQAHAEGAPHLAPDVAARLLGADLTQLDAQLRADAPAPDGVTPGGLRLDQAAAAFLALTSPRRAELIVGPAGTGKTYTAVRIARAWREAGMGRVFGIATTSAGRNVLIEAGVETAENTAQFLGHLPGQREARGATALGPDALLLLDEASTTSMPDLAAIVRHAARSGAKLVITGDHAQLGAVESGGGMAMLARKLGHAQLTEAVRFRNDWEGNASLAIRAGDVSALGTYDAHGRLHGGSYEEMAEQAARAYLAEYLAGTDVILTAFEHRECADLSRRVQGYLLDWGQLQPGATAALRETARAYAGDLILARQNDNHLQAGEPGHTLANGDLLRVDAIGEQDLTVSRLIRPGQRGRQARLVGAVHHHQVLRGRMVRPRVRPDLAHGRRPDRLGRHRPGQRQADPGGPVRGNVPRRSAGTRSTPTHPSRSPPRASSASRPRPIPRSPGSAGSRPTAQSAGPAMSAGEKDPIAILAPVVRHDDAELSATETREQALSGADHLAALHAIWMDQCRSEAHARYAQAVRDHAAPADAAEILKDTDRLWRTVRSAELAGLDGREVIRAAISGRPFTGARSHSAVLDARIREKTGHLPPRIRDSWTGEPARVRRPRPGPVHDRGRRRDG